MPGAAAQATMHDFVRRPLAETQQPQGHGVQGARSRGGSLCDDAAELSVDGMRLRRDRVQHWVFPQSKDYPTRQYQVDIAKEAILRNTLVSLPTGTGKTLIAAVVMYNFHRWFERGKIVFMAPTRPLVSQQIRACAQVTWISEQHMAELTGTVSGSERQQLWESRRIFFCTPQVFENDLEAGRCPARDVVCLVLDEAHKAQGDYAYVNVVRKIAAQTDRFRVLALTATPGSDRAKIQRVISNLRIAHVEVLHEDDPCLQRYMHAREMETVMVGPNKDMEMLRSQAQTLAGFLVQPLRPYLPRNMPVEKLSGDVTLLDEACEKWRRKRGTLTPSAFNALETAHRRLRSCVKAIDLLMHEGFGSFFNELRSFAQMEQRVDDGQYLHSPRFSQLWSRVTTINARSEPLLHPKQEALCGILLDHFTNHSADTKAIVFAQYRRVVAGIESMLNRHKPLINARCFVGQAASKGSAGMNQLEQRQLVERFKSGDGDCNVLVATSIGEEGLDIGEVDLIVQYDCLSSHIRTVQRIGRTGRKRNGRAIQLVTAGAEQEALAKQKKSANMIKKVLSRNSKWTFHSAGNFRMIPSPLPSPTLSKVDLSPADRSCTGAGMASRDVDGHATQAFLAVGRSPQDVECTTRSNQIGREVMEHTDTGLLSSTMPSRTSMLASASASASASALASASASASAPAPAPASRPTSTRLSREERAVFLQQFACSSPPVDLTLDSVVSQFPDACAVLTKPYRCAHTVLTQLLLTAAKHSQRHAGRDQIELETANLLKSSCCSLPAVSETTSVPPAMVTERRRTSSLHVHRTEADTPDSSSDDMADLLRLPDSVACHVVFCPQEIRHLLPDCLDSVKSTNSSDAGQDHIAAKFQFSTPSYVSSLTDQSVHPPPAVPRDLSAFICGTQKTDCTPSHPRPRNSTTVPHEVCLPEMTFDPEDGCSSDQPTVHAPVRTAAAESSPNGELWRIDTVVERNTEPFVDLARSEPMPAIPNEVRGSTGPQTFASAPAKPTANRGLTEEQRCRIAENRKKAQARRAELQAQKAAQHHSEATRDSDGHPKQSPAQCQRSTKDIISESQASNDPSQHQGVSQKSTPADQDSEIELGFSSPSPVATKRLRKRRHGHPMQRKPKDQGKTKAQPMKAGLAFVDVDKDTSLDEDESSQNANLQKRRRVGTDPQWQATNRRFADDEAVVSGDEDSADDSDGSETDGRNSLEGFLDDSQSQNLDIGRQSQETGSDTDTDRRGKSPANMRAVYTRSLISPDAVHMGFASPPRQHPQRNRFRTDGPRYHNDSPESETETEAEAEAEAEEEAEEAPDDWWMDRQSVSSYTQPNSASVDCHTAPRASTQREECADSSDSSPRSKRGEDLFASPPPLTSSHLQAQHDTRRDSTDGYSAEVDDDSTLENAEADFDCGVDSLWD